MNPVMLEEAQSTYAVKLSSFEGPLDLLLHLIKKNELNICDIPIAEITRQYLDTLDLIKSLNLSIAGEFLVMAATLIQIKSKMLLPVAEVEEDDEEDDPRAELVRRLLDYQRFKEAGEGLEAREQIWRDLYGRSPLSRKESPPEEISLGDLNVYELMDALRNIIERAPEKQGLEIIVDELSVQDRMGVILDALEGQDSVAFLSLFDKVRTRLSIIVTFLALLELVRLKRLRIIQGETFGVIRIWKITNSQPS